VKISPGYFCTGLLCYIKYIMAFGFGYNALSFNAFYKNIPRKGVEF
jgi:hypothetical protein